MCCLPEAFVKLKLASHLPAAWSLLARQGGCTPHAQSRAGSVGMKYCHGLTGRVNDEELCSCLAIRARMCGTHKTGCIHAGAREFARNDGAHTSTGTYCFPYLHGPLRSETSHCIYVQSHPAAYGRINVSCSKQNLPQLFSLKGVS